MPLAAFSREYILFKKLSSGPNADASTYHRNYKAANQTCSRKPDEAEYQASYEPANDAKNNILDQS